MFSCVGPPQTSPVNLELATGSVTPTSDISADQHQVHTVSKGGHDKPSKKT